MKTRNKAIISFFLTTLIVLSSFTFVTASGDPDPSLDSPESGATDRSPGASAYSPADNPYYKVVIPLDYGEILRINGDSFVSQTLHSDGSKASSLYSLHGACLISDMDEIYFEDNYIKCKRAGKSGIYTRDGEEILPCIFEAAYVDANQCMALSGGRLASPGTWEGDRVIYDLITGEIVKDIGYGTDTYYRPLDIWGPRKEKYKIEISGIYSKSGQMVVDLREFYVDYRDRAEYKPREHVFEYVTHENNQTCYTYFNVRGRFLFKSDRSWGSVAGEYFISSGEKPYVMNSDQEIVIESNAFDTYKYSTECFERDTDDRQLIVSKNGRYGVIEMLPFVSAPSSWAAGNIETAEAYGIVPENLRPLWKENCTREEFCGILALSVGHMTGKSMADLTEGMELPIFTDTESQDVQRAAALGIVEGVGDNKFYPENLITREQAAVMLSRICKRFNLEAAGAAAEFTDRKLFSSWAADGVDYVSSVITSKEGGRLMDGMGNGRFHPKGKYTVEQSITTFVRLIDAFKLSRVAS